MATCSVRRTTRRGIHHNWIEPDQGQSHAARERSSRDGSLAIFHEVIPLIVGNTHFRHNQPLIFRVNNELREKVFFVLINTAEPVVMSDSFDAFDLQNLVAVRERNHIDQSRAIDNH